MKQFRNRIENNNINRHSSQLAIRKDSANSQTPRDQDCELHKIRQTTFWMKKTIGGPTSIEMGNPKKPLHESRSRHIFSMKVNTEHSQTDSTCNNNNNNNTIIATTHNMNNSSRPQNQTGCNTKLALIQKSQRQLISETTMLVNENLPKLVNCHQLFQSFNRCLKMGIQCCGKGLLSDVVGLVDRHLENTFAIFQKVVNHANDFVVSQKCAHLITKTIQLQKQNSRLMTLCTDLTTKLSKPPCPSPCPSSPLPPPNLHMINLDRIVSMSYKFGQKQVPQHKISSLCLQLLQPVLAYSPNCPTTYFACCRNILEQVGSNKQGQIVLRQLWTHYKARDKCQDKEGFKQQSKGMMDPFKNMVIDVLTNRVNFGLLEAVKKRSFWGRGRFEKQGRLYLGAVLNMANKFNILKDTIKKKQILMGLILVVKKQTSQPCSLQKQISDALQQNFSPIYTENKSRPISSVHIPMQADHNNNPSILGKMSKLSQKRLVNCANLYQRRKKREKVEGHGHGESIQENQNTGITHGGGEGTENLEMGKIDGGVWFSWQEVIVLCYYYAYRQLQYFQDACQTLHRLPTQSPSGTPFIHKLLTTQLCAQISSTTLIKERQEVFELAGTLSQAYGDQLIVKEQTYHHAMQEFVRLALRDVVGCLGRDRERRLVLSELQNQIQ